MDYALDVITEKLISTGMSRTEADHLLARFLEEEAFDYVEYMKLHLEEDQNQPVSENLYS